MTVTIRIQEIILDYSNAVKTLVSRALETRRIVGVLLDPEKAFDEVDHSILLT